MGQVFSFTLQSVFPAGEESPVNNTLGETLTDDLYTLKTVKITCPWRDSKDFLKFIFQNFAICPKTFSNRVDSHY
jgi:hypothetical protein